MQMTENAQHAICLYGTILHTYTQNNIRKPHIDSIPNIYKHMYINI